MYRIRLPFRLPALLSAVLLASACASSPEATTVADGSLATDFQARNVLVIGVGNDYEARTRFERGLATELRSAGVSAAAFYVAAGGNKPIEREAIEALVASRGFDAVLISKVVNRDSSALLKTGPAGTKAVRRDGSPIDLFRYDYEELNEPAFIDVDLSATISSELFATGSGERVWVHETSVAHKDIADLLIDAAVERIVRRLERDNIIAR